MSKTKKQFFKSFFMGGISTITEYIIFVICQYWIFKPLSNKSFIFGPLKYEIVDGGLCLFLSNAISFLLAILLNYFIQSRFVFKSEQRNKKTLGKYLLASSVAYAIILYTPGLIGSDMNGIFGYHYGPLATKTLATFFGFCTQFPLNKLFVFK